MKVVKEEKIICCVLAAILLFLGMSVAAATTDFSFLRAANTTNTTLRSADHIVEETPVCTPNMLRSSSAVIRNNMNNTVNRWQGRAVLTILIVAAFLQYLFYYQESECREDGQLFLCRSVIVDYIHQKDNGE